MSLKLKKIIIILSILIIGVLIAFIIVKIKFNKYVYETPQDEKLRIENTSQIDIEWRLVSSPIEYFHAKKAIEEYYLAIDILDQKEEYLDRYDFTEQEFEEYAKENLLQVYNLLSKNYLEEFNITKNNIDKYYNNIYEGNKIFIINDVYRKDLNENLVCLVVFGKTVNLENEKVEDYGFIINLDNVNLCYEICPYEYMKEKKIDKEHLNNINFNIEAISLNENNSFEIKVIQESQIAEEYFNIYKQNLLYDVEHLYDLLDDEYKEKRFNNLNNFKEYVEDNIQNLSKSYVEQYKVENYDEYTQYVCVDQNGIYYIFNEEDFMKVNIILDTYTIDIPEFLEKYNSANEQGKVALNIDKFFKAINVKDYSYAYNCLVQSFKSNYFKTQSEFENYAKNNFFSNNLIKYAKFSKKSDDIYVFDIEINNRENDGEPQKTNSFIVKLRRGNKF